MNQIDYLNFPDTCNMTSFISLESVVSLLEAQMMKNHACLEMYECVLQIYGGPTYKRLRPLTKNKPNSYYCKPIFNRMQKRLRDLREPRRRKYLSPRTSTQMTLFYYIPANLHFDREN